VARQSDAHRSGETPVWTTFEHSDVLGRMTKKTVPKQPVTRTTARRGAP
jgi:hypothetical protein